MSEFIPPGTRWIDLPSPFAMKRGGELHGARIAYETWGQLNAAADNAVLVVPGMSPDAHMAASASNPAAGWWEPMVGPGKPIDTGRWFVICANPLGSCKGSTGPASINPDTGRPYRFQFPELSIEDGADALAHVVRALGIERLACVVGNSMGGMVALSLLIRHPGIAVAHLNVSGAARALPWSIAIRSLQREAIRLDPHFNGGDYSDEAYPESGMRMARKLGVITYRSALEWDGRFGRVRLDSEQTDDEPFGLEFQVESYLEAHARRFVHSFDPNCYLYLSRSMDWFDLGDHCATREIGDRALNQAHTRAGLAAIHIQRARAIGAETDVLFPLQQQMEIADGLREGGAIADCIPMPSPQGHDAFLVDFDRYCPAIREFFASL